ncbi:hypothetical protein DFH06DRAFT_1137593 [Mycena polygramma]|nr:hypothetical protein DFH06DRAFT_1137593 [Mycena polygramma]
MYRSPRKSPGGGDEHETKQNNREQARRRGGESSDKFTRGERMCGKLTAATFKQKQISTQSGRTKVATLPKESGVRGAGFDRDTYPLADNGVVGVEKASAEEVRNDRGLAETELKERGDGVGDGQVPLPLEHVHDDAKVRGRERRQTIENGFVPRETAQINEFTTRAVDGENSDTKEGNAGDLVLARLGKHAHSEAVHGAVEKRSGREGAEAVTISGDGDADIVTDAALAILADDGDSVQESFHNFVLVAVSGVENASIRPSYLVSPLLLLHGGGVTLRLMIGRALVRLVLCASNEGQQDDILVDALLRQVVLVLDGRATDASAVHDHSVGVKGGTGNGVVDAVDGVREHGFVDDRVSKRGLLREEESGVVRDNGGSSGGFRRKSVLKYEIKLVSARISARRKADERRKSGGERAQGRSAGSQGTSGPKRSVGGVDNRATVGRGRTGISVVIGVEIVELVVAVFDGERRRGREETKTRAMS